MAVIPMYKEYDKIDVGAELLHKNKISIDIGPVVFLYERQENVEKEIVLEITNKIRKISQIIYYPPGDGCSAGIKRGINMEELYEFDKVCDKFFDSINKQ